MLPFSLDRSTSIISSWCFSSYNSGLMCSLKEKLSYIAMVKSAFMCFFIRVYSTVRFDRYISNVMVRNGRGSCNPSGRRLTPYQVCFSQLRISSQSMAWPKCKVTKLVCYLELYRRFFMILIVNVVFKVS